MPGRHRPGRHFARLAVAPIFPSDAEVTAFGLAIDRIRLVVVRQGTPPDTLADTTVVVPPDAETIDLTLRVPLVSTHETMLVSIIAMSRWSRTHATSTATSRRRRRASISPTSRSGMSARTTG